MRDHAFFSTEQAQWQTLFDAAPLGIYLVDSDFRIRAVNPTARPFFGDIPGLIGRDFDEVAHILWSPEHANEIVRLFRHTLKTGESYTTWEQIEERRDRAVDVEREALVRHGHVKDAAGLQDPKQVLKRE